MQMKMICLKCNRNRPAICVGADGCDVCRLERQREADQAAFDAKQPKAVDGVVVKGMEDHEIETVRDALLDKSGWSQFPDRRAKIGPQKAKEWDDYRTALDEEARAARREKRPPNWPNPPT